MDGARERRQASWWWEHALAAVDCAVGKNHRTAVNLQEDYQQFCSSLFNSADAVAESVRPVVVATATTAGTPLAPSALSPFRETWQIQDLPTDRSTEAAIIDWGTQRTAASCEPIFALYMCGENELLLFTSTREP